MISFSNWILTIFNKSYRNLSYFALASLSVSLLSLGMYSINNKLTSDVQFFKESIRRSLLNGNYFESSRLCKVFFNSSNLSQLRVYDSFNKEVCQFTKDESVFLPISASQIVHDNSGRNIILGRVESAVNLLSFAQNYLLLAALWLAVFLYLHKVLNTLINKKLNSFIKQPINEIKSILSITTTEELAKATFKKTNIREFDHVLESYSSLGKKLKNSEEEVRKKEIDIALTQQHNKIARQVAHDIRSPLTCLDTIAKRSNSLNDNEKSLIEKSVSRINEVAEDLLKKERDGKSTSDSSLSMITQQNIQASQSDISDINLASLITDTINEKSLEYSTNENLKIQSMIDPSAVDSHVKMNPKKLKRVLSNLVNNAVEAIQPESKGFISTSLSKEDNQLIIEIRDNGKGISESNLRKILEKGTSIGKENGNGLGVSYAKQFTESLNGSFKMFSREGLGTTVRITL